MKNVFRPLDLNLLRVFDALMAEGSVTRASHRLALSQSAVGNALSRISGRFAKASRPAPSRRPATPGH